MTVTELPVDIKERIVFELADEAKTLSSLLSTSFDFRRPAEKLIFRKIDVRYEPVPKWINRKSPVKLLEALTGNEELISFIQDITVTFAPEKPYDPFDEESDDDEASSPDPTFPQLLELLDKASIVSLTLQSIASGRQYRHFDLGHFPLATIARLLALRCQPTLRRLTLDNLSNMPVLLVAGNPATDHVTSLNLSRYPIATRKGARTLAPFNRDNLPSCLGQILKDKVNTPFRWLEELEMSDPGCFPLYICRTIPDSIEVERRLAALPLNGDDEEFSDAEYEDPTTSFTFPSLRTLRIGIQNLNQDDVLISSVIVQHAPALETLVIQDDLSMKNANRMDTFTASYLLGTCLKSSKARHLVLKNTAYCDKASKAVGSIGNLLQNMFPANFTEKLTLDMKWMGDEMAGKDSLKRLFNPRNQWPAFKQALTNFPRLKQLELKFSIVEVDYEPDAKERALFEQLVERLSTGFSFKGKVQVERSLSMREMNMDDEYEEEGFDDDW